MRAGAERHAGVELQNDAVRFGTRLPRGQHEQPASDRKRLIVLFPVVRPVLVVDGDHRGQKRSEIRGMLHGFEPFDRGLRRLDGRQVFGAVGNVALDAGRVRADPVHVGEVPEDRGFAQKRVRLFAALLDGQSHDPRAVQRGADGIDSFVGRIDRDLQPFHVVRIPPELFQVSITQIRPPYK